MKPEKPNKEIPENYLLSNSRDFWKAEAVRLKKEKEEIYADIIHEGHIKGVVNRQVKQALSELRDFLKHEIKEAERIRDSRSDISEDSKGIRQRQFHRTAVKYKGMVIAFNKVLKAIDSKKVK